MKKCARICIGIYAWAEESHDRQHPIQFDVSRKLNYTVYGARLRLRYSGTLCKTGCGGNPRDVFQTDRE